MIFGSLHASELCHARLVIYRWLAFINITRNTKKINVLFGLCKHLRPNIPINEALCFYKHPQRSQFRLYSEDYVHFATTCDSTTWSKHEIYSRFLKVVMLKRVTGRKTQFRLKRDCFFLFAGIQSHRYPTYIIIVYNKVIIHNKITII